MSKINGIIPAQAFELIRNQIGAILFTELENQVVNYGRYDLDIDVFIERNNPIDGEEEPGITVNLSSGAYDNKNQGDIRGTYEYHIDVYTSAKSDVENDLDGDHLSALQLQKILGVCRAILENPVYKTLDFNTNPPFIQGTICKEINIAKIPTKNDARNTAMGRITFSVRANETTSLLTTIPLSSAWTGVKLELTEKGYQYKTA